MARYPELTEEECQSVLNGDTDGLSKHQIHRRKKKAAELGLTTRQIDKCDEFGIPPEYLRGGWEKDGNASYRFAIPEVDQSKEDYIDAIKDALSGEIGSSATTQAPVTNDQLLTRYIIADLHLGMMSWGEQTGQDYDLAIASKYLNEAMGSLVESTPNSDTALILNLGDTFHANDSKNKTPMSGHILDMDGRFPKIALAGVKAIRRCIDMALEKHRKVIYAGVQGNHDIDQAHWLNIALMMHYENNERVEVRWNPSEFFAMPWGLNGIYAHHGDKAKFERIAMYIPDQFRKMWGETYWSTCDTGHIHHESAKDVGGVLFRSYRTLAAKDAYSAGHAYTSRQTLTAITVHKERGEIATNRHNIYPPQVA